MPANRTEDPGAAETSAAEPTPPRMRRVRVTVDLEPEDHRKLQRWCARAADELGRVSVAQVDVVRALLGRLHGDPELARQVMNTLRNQR